MPREDTTEDSLLAVSWQRVLQGFDRLASMPMISLVAVVIDGDGDPSAFIHELAARENRAHWQATPIRAVDGRPGEYQAVVASHRLFAFGELETWEAFRVAAMRAGVLAKSVSERLLPGSVRDRMSHLDRWAWALFEVGWRKLDTIPFHAERWVRDDGGVIQLEFAHTAGRYRGWYYSEVGDAVSASIDVVNVFRPMERVGLGSAAASPAKDDETAEQRSGRKHRKDSGNRIKKDVRREIVIGLLDEIGGWDGAWAGFLVELKRKKGIEISEPTLGRYLKDTKYARRRRGNPHRAVRASGKRSREIEAVADDGSVDMSGVDYYSLSDDE